MGEKQAVHGLSYTAEGQELTIERIFNAPKHLVFQAYAEKEHLEAWWGPEGWETTVSQFEFTPGGVWLYCMKCHDKNQGDFYGQVSCGKAVYQEIIQNEKIVYIDFFTDQEGNVMKEMPEMAITMEFHEEGAQTKLITRSTFASAELLQQVKDMGMLQGTASQFEKLDTYLEKLA